jgi:hypothetical protein
MGNRPGKFGRLRQLAARVLGSQVFPSVARPADGGEQIEVRLRSSRIGTLSAANSAGFWSYLDKAEAQGRRVAVMGLGDQDVGGAWALRIYLPHPGPGQDQPAGP